MGLEHLGAAAFVFFARVADVALGTFRTSLVVSGRRGLAWAVAFAESSIWLLAVSRALQDLDDPILLLAFALGFATGTFVGITIEGVVALGEQVLRVFTKEGARVAAVLRERGLRVTRFPGEGRDAPVDLLFIQLRRRQAREVVQLAREYDPECFCVIDDVRMAVAARRPAVPIRR